MRFRLVTIVLYASIAYAQQENSGPATSHAKCSPPVTGTKNTVIVHCNDLQSREDIKKLLQMIHDSGASTQQILKKLDQMAEEMKGRHLTADQIRSFSELLKPMAGSTVAISCNQSSDSCLLADDLATVFNNAAWFDYDDLPENGPPGHRETIRARTNHTAGNDYCRK
jgi:hypothetical protein